jgi:predicted amidohydrolase
VLFINPIEENQGTLLVCSFIGVNVQNYRKTHLYIDEIEK